jgi:hypothetical protein
MDAAAMSLELHGCGIHAVSLRSEPDGGRLPGRYTPHRASGAQFIKKP